MPRTATPKMIGTAGSLWTWVCGCIPRRTRCAIPVVTAVAQRVDTGSSRCPRMAMIGSPYEHTQETLHWEIQGGYSHSTGHVGVNISVGKGLTSKRKRVCGGGETT